MLELADELELDKERLGLLLGNEELADDERLLEIEFDIEELLNSEDTDVLTLLDGEALPPEAEEKNDLDTEDFIGEVIDEMSDDSELRTELVLLPDVPSCCNVLLS